MILLIDNYDSFSYNLFQLVGCLRPDIKVIRNDACTVEEIGKMKPEAIIISPGPGKPKDAGICEAVVRELGDRIPILGVCLGHQAICEAYGAKIVHAAELMHGKQSVAVKTAEDPLLEELGERIPVARYHSLAVDENTLPEELIITSRADDGEVMSVRHSRYPVYGLQYHPESILTPDGKKILKNFIDIIGK